jgi:hypothetical protein
MGHVTPASSLALAASPIGHERALVGLVAPAPRRDARRQGRIDDIQGREDLPRGATSRDRVVGRRRLPQRAESLKHVARDGIWRGWRVVAHAVAWRADHRHPRHAVRMRHRIAKRDEGHVRMPDQIDVLEMPMGAHGLEVVHVVDDAAAERVGVADSFGAASVAQVIDHGRTALPQRGQVVHVVGAVGHDYGRRARPREAIVETHAVGRGDVSFGIRHERLRSRRGDAKAWAQACQPAALTVRAIRVD